MNSSHDDAVLKSLGVADDLIEETMSSLRQWGLEGLSSKSPRYKIEKINSFDLHDENNKTFLKIFIPILIALVILGITSSSFAWIGVLVVSLGLHQEISTKVERLRLSKNVNGKWRVLEVSQCLSQLVERVKEDAEYEKTKVQLFNSDGNPI